MFGGGGVLGGGGVFGRGGVFGGVGFVPTGRFVLKSIKMPLPSVNGKEKITNYFIYIGRHIHSQRTRSS